MMREFRVSDASALYRYQSEPGYLRFSGWENRSRDSVTGFVELLCSWKVERPRTIYQLAITHRGRLIGSCGLRKETVGNSTAELCCELDPAQWQRGFAVEASLHMLSFGFGVLRLTSAWARVASGNESALRLARRLGFREDGRRRQLVSKDGFQKAMARFIG